MMEFKPNGLITGIISALIIGAVLLIAIVVRVYVTGTTFYENYQKNSNSSQSNTTPKKL